MRVIGLDPGSNVTGYAVVEGHPVTRGVMIVEAGFIRLKGSTGQKLRTLREDLAEILLRLRPTHACVESPFVQHRNAIIPLSQARGVILETVADLPTIECAPSQTKKAAGCHRAASKEQVMRGIEVLTGQQIDQPDTADAVAVAMFGLTSAVAAGRRASP